MHLKASADENKNTIYLILLGVPCELLLEFCRKCQSGKRIFLLLVYVFTKSHLELRYFTNKVTFACENKLERGVDCNHRLKMSIFRKKPYLDYNQLSGPVKMFFYSSFKLHMGPPRRANCEIE